MDLSTDLRTDWEELTKPISKRFDREVEVQLGRDKWELPEDIVLDERLMAAVYELAEKGYVIVLDNFRYHEKLVPLVKLAQIVKIDIQVVDDQTLREYVQQLHQHQVKLQAIKVEL